MPLPSLLRNLATSTLLEPSSEAAFFILASDRIPAKQDAAVYSL